MIVIDRGDYYQCAYIIPKGSDSQLRADGVESLQRTIVSLVPWLADRVGEPLSAGKRTTRDLARVQRRRWLPTALVQGVQRVIHARVIAAAVSGDEPGTPPLGVRLVSKWAFLRRVAGYAVAIGPLPERAPAYARR